MLWNFYIQVLIDLCNILTYLEFYLILNIIDTLTYIKIVYCIIRFAVKKKKTKNNNTCFIQFLIEISEINL